MLMYAPVCVCVLMRLYMSVYVCTYVCMCVCMCVYTPERLTQQRHDVPVSNPNGKTREGHRRHLRGLGESVLALGSSKTIWKKESEVMGSQAKRMKKLKCKRERERERERKWNNWEYKKMERRRKEEEKKKMKIQKKQKWKGNATKRVSQPHWYGAYCQLVADVIRWTRIKTGFQLLMQGRLPNSRNLTQHNLPSFYFSF